MNMIMETKKARIRVTRYLQQLLASAVLPLTPQAIVFDPVGRRTPRSHAL